MKMKVLLVVVLCVVVKGQNYAYQAADHVPHIKDGVPIDTPEVQAAKAAHFEAFERARVLAAKNPSNGQYEETVPKYQQQYRQQQYQVQQYQPQQYQQTYQTQQYQPQSYQQQNLQTHQYQQQHYQNNVFYQQPRQQQYSLASYSSDLPIDTPEVQQARAAHLAALSQAQNHHYRLRRSIFAYSAAPQETPEVQLAKYQHLIAHASVHDEDDDDYYYSPSEDFYHVPIITRKGVPVNTASVKAARQQHRIAHELEKSGVQYSGGFSVGKPVLTPNGVPFDTPEVYIAKVQHLAAHAEESTKHNQWGLYEGYGGGYGF